MRYCVLLAGMIFATAARAAGDMDNMPGMDMSAMPMTGVLGPYPMTREASGTSWQPDAATHQGCTRRSAIGS